MLFRVKASHLTLAGAIRKAQSSRARLIGAWTTSDSIVLIGGLRGLSAMIALCYSRWMNSSAGRASGRMGRQSSSTWRLQLGKRFAAAQASTACGGGRATAHLRSQVLPLRGCRDGCDGVDGAILGCRSPPLLGGTAVQPVYCRFVIINGFRMKIKGFLLKIKGFLLKMKGFLHRNQWFPLGNL